MDNTLKLLARYESRNVTYIDPNGGWPIVWQRASGMHVWDASGKRYLDLTAAFGVANAGHANAKVVRAGQRQMQRLLHAMGDVHPHPLKAQLAQCLSQITFENWTHKKIHARTLFCNSGFEAVEAALKTALLATNRPGVIAFEGAYHGLGYGALNATHRAYFRAPFQTQLRNFTKAVPFPSADADLSRTESALRKLAATKKFGAILVEPIQGRAGIRIPPPEFLPLLRRVCDQHKILLLLDEVFTGFGRAGAMFACEHSKTIPDLICLGKALTGGFPLSACVGRADLMDKAWPPSHGEALHTSTFLGHPVGCAMALAQIGEVQKLLPQTRARGEFLLKQFAARNLPARGVGLMGAVNAPNTATALRAVKRLLHRGYIFLPEGENSDVISFTPPLIISENQIRQSVGALAEELRP